MENPSQEFQEWFSTTSDIFDTLPGMSDLPPPPPSLLSPESKLLELSTQSQQLYSELLPQESAPRRLDAPNLCNVSQYQEGTIYPAPVYNNQAGASEHGQHNDALQVVLPNSKEENLNYAGMINKKFEEQEEDECPYIKKPLNAFLLFMMEQRPYVDAVIKRKGNGAVTSVLAKRWKSMTTDQQSKYYTEAEKQRLLHKQRHPEWSNRENYGRKKRERKRKAAKNKSVKAFLTDNQPKVVELGPHFQQGVKGPHHQQAAIAQPQKFNMDHLPEGSDDCCLDSPTNFLEMLTSTHILPQWSFSEQY